MGDQPHASHEPSIFQRFAYTKFFQRRIAVPSITWLLKPLPERRAELQVAKDVEVAVSTLIRTKNGLQRTPCTAASSLHISAERCRRHRSERLADIKRMLWTRVLDFCDKCATDTPRQAWVEIRVYRQAAVGNIFCSKRNRSLPDTPPLLFWEYSRRRRNTIYHKRINRNKFNTQGDTRVEGKNTKGPTDKGGKSYRPNIAPCTSLQLILLSWQHHPCQNDSLRHFIHNVMATLRTPHVIWRRSSSVRCSQRDPLLASVIFSPWIISSAQETRHTPRNEGQEKATESTENYG